MILKNWPGKGVILWTLKNWPASLLCARRLAVVGETLSRHCLIPDSLWGWLWSGRQEEAGCLVQRFSWKSEFKAVLGSNKCFLYCSSKAPVCYQAHVGGPARCYVLTKVIIRPEHGWSLQWDYCPGAGTRRVELMCFWGKKALEVSSSMVFTLSFIFFPGGGPTEKVPLHILAPFPMVEGAPTVSRALCFKC